MTFWKRDRIHLTLSWMLVGLSGAVEGLYGRTHYMSDWVSYLNVSQAVSSLDWKDIFDPMWNPGYPALIALARSLAPHTPEGEWYAISALNWVIFLATYASVRYLIRQAAAFDDNLAASEVCRPAVTWAVCSVFLSYELCFDQVSRIAPDLLVSMLFILGVAQVLRVIRLHSAKQAAILGLILGLGYWVKSVFLPYATIFMLVLVLTRFAGKIRWRTIAIVASVFLALMVPYVSAISWSYGQFTLGSSGELNYAFHVNHLPHWTNWQGGPPEFGTPLHPTVRLVEDLPAFSFREPFASTYPPYNNMAYWYRGFRHFFSFGNQLTALGRTAYGLAGIFKGNQIVCALLLVFLAILLKRDWLMSGLRSARTFWPLHVLPLLVMATYMLVHVEGRYLSALLLVISLFPLTLLFDPALKAKRSLLALISVLYIAGGFAELQRYEGATIWTALGHRDLHLNPEWRLATAVTANGLRPGDTIALIGRGNEVPSLGWAYIARIRIVAEFGGLPWRIEPPFRTPLDHAGPEEADKNWGTAFWQLPLEQRERVIQAFHRVGVRAIVSMSQPDPGSIGWVPLKNTEAWIYTFDSRLTTSLAAIQQAAGENRAGTL